MQRSQGELANTLAANIDVIGHVQIADTNGWIGCEYLPSGGAGSASGWMRDWRRR